MVMIRLIVVTSISTAWLMDLGVSAVSLSLLHNCDETADARNFFCLSVVWSTQKQDDLRGLLEVHPAFLHAPLVMGIRLGRDAPHMLWHGTWTGLGSRWAFLILRSPGGS